MSRHSAIKSVFWLVVSEVLFNLSGYIIHAVAGLTLGPADYGRYSLVVTLTTVVIVLVGNGIPTAMAKYLSEIFETDPSKITPIKRQTIRLQTLLMGGVTLAFFLLSPVIAALLGDPTLTPLFRLSSLIIPAFAAASFYFSYFTGLHLFHYQSALKSFRSIARVTVIVGLVLAFGLKGAIIGYILAPFFTFLLGISFDIRSAKRYGLVQDEVCNPVRTFASKTTGSGYKPEPAINKQTLESNAANQSVFPANKLLSYAWPMTLFMLFYELFTTIDLYLVKSLLHNDAATGLYNAALTIGKIPYYFFYALAIFLLPALSKMNAEQDTEKMKTLMTQALRWSGILLVPATILIAAYAEPLSVLFFGERFTSSAHLLAILVSGLSFLTVFYLICSALNGIGQVRTSMYLAVVGALANTILNVFAIRTYGLSGAAWATSIGAAITTIVAFIASQRSIPVSFNLENTAKTLFAGAMLFLATTLFPAHDWKFIPLSIMLGLGYLAILASLGVISKADLPTKMSSRT